MPLPSSTVMTPSLPTFSITSPMSSPTVGSAAEMDATCDICSRVVTRTAFLRMWPEIASAPASRPRLSAMGFAPAATLRMPSWTMDCASTVAVVVPSPAMSLVREATSLANCAPMLWNGFSSSMSLAIVTPSFVMVGAPNDFASTTLRPLGPSVIFTASARAPIPARSAPRASSSNRSSFGITWSLTLVERPLQPLRVAILGGLSTLLRGVLTRVCRIVRADASAPMTLGRGAPGSPLGPPSGCVATGQETWSIQPAPPAGRNGPASSRARRRGQ